MKNKPFSYRLYRSFWGALDLLFPPVCGGCGKPGSRWCESCRGRVEVLSGILCDVCGLPQNAAGVCPACRAERPHFRALRGWAAFEEPLRGALHQLKYRRNMSMGDVIAAQMLPFVEGLHWRADMLVPIPLSPKRLKERGYNQVGMIATPLSLALGVPCAPRALTRPKETRSQVGLSHHERKENIRGAFSASGEAKGKTVALLDDVATTGSTLSAAAEALLAAGAREVYALAVARALPVHGLRQA